MSKPLSQIIVELLGKSIIVSRPLINFEVNSKGAKEVSIMKFGAEITWKAAFRLVFLKANDGMGAAKALLLNAKNENQP